MSQKEIDKLVEKIQVSKKECKECAYLVNGKHRYYKCYGGTNCPAAKNL